MISPLHSHVQRSPFSWVFYHNVARKVPVFASKPKFFLLRSDSSSLGFSIRLDPSSLFRRKFGPSRCGSDGILVEPSHFLNDAPKSTEMHKQDGPSIRERLKKSNSILPHVVFASTLLALIFPCSFTWFTNRYYPLALGFLMFAVGVNSSEKDFLEAFRRPEAIFAGYICQYTVKPLIGYIISTSAVTIFGLPTSLGAGIALTACVSGAQLANYATFLTDPPMAPLSIVMTSLSTATAVVVTPMLTLLLIGKQLPVDVKGMVSSIIQIVVAPIVTGLLLNRLFPQTCEAIKQFLPPLSVLVTALCVGSPLAINRAAVMSPFGRIILLLIVVFHLSSFISGYALAGIVFCKATDVKALQRTISFQTGMQSSLLALALANRFFQDSLVSVAPAISVVVMSLMGFFLVMLWTRGKALSGE